MSTAVEPTREDVLAFRLAGHHLDRRVPATALDEVVGAIGLRDVQGSGALALHARLDKVSPMTINEAVARGEIVRVVSARGVDTLIPAKDLGVFTVGTLPADEESLRVRLKPFLPDLDASGHTATEAVELAIARTREVLADGPVDIGVLSGELTRSLPELSPMCRGRCGRRHIEQGVLDLVGESGIWRREPDEDQRRLLYMAMAPPSASFEECRRELVRRYLRCYGPSTAAEFAEWCGISKSDAARSLAAEDTTVISRRGFVLTEDADRLSSSPMPRGLRLLPPRDPYLLGRDRMTIVPERDVQRRIWRATPTDGVALHDGEVVATLRTKKKATELTLLAKPTRPLPSSLLEKLSREAAAIAKLRGCLSARVVESS